MDGDASGAGDSEPIRRAVRVEGWGRFFIGAIGVGFLGAGGVACFVSDNQAGTVGLLVVGSAAGLITGSGYMPTLLKWGDAEAHWGDVPAPIADVLEEEMSQTDDRERAVEVARAVTDSFPPDSATNVAIPYSSMRGTPRRPPGAARPTRSRDRLFEHAQEVLDWEDLYMAAGQGRLADVEIRNNEVWHGDTLIMPTPLDFNAQTEELTDLARQAVSKGARALVLVTRRILLDTVGPIEVEGHLFPVATVRWQRDQPTAPLRLEAAILQAEGLAAS